MFHEKSGLSRSWGDQLDFTEEVTSEPCHKGRVGTGTPSSGFLGVDVLAEPRDPAGSVPDHRDKVNIKIKQSHKIYWLPRLYKSYIYAVPQSIKCVITVSKKNYSGNIQNH